MTGLEPGALNLGSRNQEAVRECKIRRFQPPDCNGRGSHARILFLISLFSDRPQALGPSLTEE
jgi:hypothetical protein